MVRWVCGCPICRILVHPVVNALSSSAHIEYHQQREEGGVAEEVAQEPVVAGTGPQPLEAGVPAGAPAGGAQPVQQPIEVKVPEEVMERISKLEEEIRRVREDLGAVSEGLKSAVIEFREMMAEVTSPFNALRGNGNGNHNGDGKTKTNGKRRIAPSTFVELLKVVDGMLNEMDKETVVSLLSGYARAGIISETVGASLAEIVELAHMMRSKGVSVERQLPYLYALAQALRIEDQSLTALLLREMVRRGGLG